MGSGQLRWLETQFDGLVEADGVQWRLLNWALLDQGGAAQLVRRGPGVSAPGLGLGRPARGARRARNTLAVSSPAPGLRGTWLKVTLEVGDTLGRALTRSPGTTFGTRSCSSARRRV